MGEKFGRGRRRDQKKVAKQREAIQKRYSKRAIKTAKATRVIGFKLTSGITSGNNAACKDYTHAHTAPHRQSCIDYGRHIPSPPETGPHYMITQQEFCYNVSRVLRPASTTGTTLPSLLSCKTSCSARKARLTARPGCPASLLVLVPIRSSCAAEASVTWPLRHYASLTRTIFVSSSSFCTFMIVSACFGS